MKNKKILSLIIYIYNLFLITLKSKISQILLIELDLILHSNKIYQIHYIITPIIIIILIKLGPKALFYNNKFKQTIILINNIFPIKINLTLVISPIIIILTQIVKIIFKCKILILYNHNITHKFQIMINKSFK